MAETDGARWRLVIAGGPWLNAEWAALCPPDWEVVGCAETLEQVGPLVREHHPTVVVLSATCPGVDGLLNTVKDVFFYNAAIRIVLVVEAIDPATQKLIYAAAPYAVFHIIVGNPSAAVWRETITADRYVQDVMPYYPDANRMQGDWPQRPAPVFPPASSAGSPAPIPASAPDSAGVVPFKAPRGTWLRHLRKGWRPPPDETVDLPWDEPDPPGPDPVARVIVRPRRVLVVGSHGGVGVSGLVGALAREWQRIGLPMAVADCAATGGFLPLLWGCEPVDQGWDTLDDANAWIKIPPRTLLMAQTGTMRPPPRVDVVQPFVQSLLSHIPGEHGPAVLIDGGTDPAWSGALSGLIDGVVVVTTTDPLGLYAGSRLIKTLQMADQPLLGWVATHQRKSPGRLSIGDLVDQWQCPCLAVFPEDAERWGRLWSGQMLPALTTVIAPLAQQLLELSGPG